MKILHVTPFYEPAWAYGGMARASSALCRALAQRGHVVVVVTARHDPAHPGEEILGDVTVHRFPGPEFLRDRLFPWGRGLRDFLRSRLTPPDVAHLHGHRSGIAVTAASALARQRTPWVFEPGGTFPHHYQWRVVKWLFDRAAGDPIVRGAAATIAVSHAEARDLPKGAHVIPNGVAAPGSVPARAPSSGETLLFVGSDRFQKRGHLLPALLEARPAAELLLAGRFGPSFLSRFDRFGSRVRHLGVLEGDRLAAAYASADLLVHPGVGEAFGLVPFEAALCGTPAVVAGGHGCGEWFAAAGGCVVPPDDVSALTQAVARRAADPELRARETVAVSTYARRELTWERAAEAVEGVYERVTAGSRRA